MANKKVTHTTISSYLVAELELRKRKNSSYSLRAFAKFLEISPALLSQIINSKKDISKSMLQHLAEKLELGQDELVALDPVNSYKSFPEDSFEETSEWYYFAIMELLTAKGFRPSSEWLSKVLNLDKSTVEEALIKLSKIGFIEIDGEGNWIDVSNKNSTTINHVMTKSHAKLQKQFLELAADAIDNYPPEERGQWGMTMAIDPSKVLEAKDLIVKFQRELTAFLIKGEKSQVYQLGISLFPLSNNTSEIEISD